MLLTAALLAVPVPALLQEGDLLEGHSGHGEAFNEGPRQSAYLMDRPDSVHFPISTPDARLQEFFDQGVGQLHAFWFFEAERTFRQVAAEDPECAMAYWGMAMANVENPERAAKFARVAWLKRGLADEREQMWIDAIARYYDVEGPEEPDDGGEDAEDEEAQEAEEAEEKRGDEDDEPLLTLAEKEAETKAAKERRDGIKERAEQLVRDYEDIIWAYPDDIEAKAILVNRLWRNRYAGHAITSRQANEALLQQILAVEPTHPSHHYRIHLWDQEENAEHVVEAAVKSGPSWPSAAHMWHMGGHIFDKLGRHTDAAWQQEASARVDHAHMMRDWVLPDQIGNFPHNNEWLTRSLRHHGRVDEAVDLARNMIELPRHPKYNMLDMRGCSASYGRARLLETLSLYEQWQELVDLAGTMYLEPSEEATDGALRAWSLGRAHAHLGNREELTAQIAVLEAMVDHSQAQRAEALDEAEERAIAEDFESGDMRGVMEDVLDEYASELQDVRDKIATLEALWAVLNGEEALDNLELLGEKDYEKAHLARLYLETGDEELQGRAVEIAREGIEDRAGRLVPHATLAEVLYFTGEEEEALEVFDELREWTARADLELPAFKRLAPLAEARELPADWRVPVTVPEDVGERGDLTALGPLRWSPPEAPAWTAPDAFGGEVSLSDYEGRPVLVIFFLGFGCVHCVEQLLEFAPVYEEYLAAGIDLVTIGTNTVEELAESFGDDPEDTGYPFPVLADPDLELFELYRAHDDFEQMPLHGTFLIDGEGRVRWQDVSYEPFMDWEFLLEESQRLLGLEIDAPATSARGASEAGGSVGAGR